MTRMKFDDDDGDGDGSGDKVSFIFFLSILFLLPISFSSALKEPSHGSKILSFSEIFLSLSSNSLFFLLLKYSFFIFYLILSLSGSFSVTLPFSSSIQ